VLAGIAGFILALQVSLAGVYRTARPDLVLKATPFDAGARARLAERIVAYGSPNEHAIARNLAFDAIRRDPLQPIALRVVGEIVQDGQGGSQSALPLILQAQRLSRRDLQTQIWLIQHYGSLADPGRMVRHIDLALRSSVPARSNLFPLLVSAASGAQERKVILDTLAARPNWAYLFAAYATEAGTNLDFAVEVGRIIFDPREAEDRARWTTLLHRLANGGQYETAWALFSDPALRLKVAGSADKVVRNGNFEAAGGNTPFDWFLAEEPELWASREKLGGGSFVLRVAAHNGRVGEAARQIAHLTDGQHRLRVRVGDVPSDPFERPEIRIECTGGTNSNELLALRPDTARSQSQTLERQFFVPQNCPFQRLTIRVAGEGAPNEPVSWVDDIGIE
jgi:hypothetical protein